MSSRTPNSTSSKPARKKLCTAYRNGACTTRDCEYDHVDCTNKACIPNPQAKCLFGHPQQSHLASLDNASVTSSSTGGGRKRLCTAYRNGACTTRDCEYSHVDCTNKACIPNPEAKCLFGHPLQSSSAAPDNASVTSSSTGGGRKRLCKAYRNGTCTTRDCEYSHVDCTNKSCVPTPQAKCLFGHPPQEVDEDAFDDDESCAVSSLSSTSVALTDFPSSSRPCMSGAQCFRVGCRFVHPEGWSACGDGIDCVDFECPSNHPYGRIRRCRAGRMCWNSSCRFLHPIDWAACTQGSSCCQFECIKTHPPGRLSVCGLGMDCRNADCDNLHPEDWDPEPIPHSSVSRFTSKPRAQRLAEREAASLPIFARMRDITDRLRAEKVLVVTAATGSGKTTQIPQYCAEEFGGIVACTQPRVMAAISISKRIALEYDGSSVGNSVGYQVGGRGNTVEGDDIMLMTDAALVKMSQEDSLLRKIKVLIIDEAHERNLNTDIVLGIAKLIRRQRPDDFFVVIASATIDPRPFLDFFESSHESLDVPGRVFPVTVDYKPTDIRVSSTKKLISDHVIPSVVEAVEEYTEGHVLIFLPGQAEIEQALKAFAAVSSELPDFVVFPLFGSLPPEEQDKVMQFDGQSDGQQRMIVFTTNVAETSLTIPGVKLVIDVGLAKEVRYDQVRRLSVIELVRISRSSADQRKGRAGRISSGHCLRLYSEEELVRNNIEPEIVRSSLDTVTLQLVRLGYNPLKFPFMTKPDASALRNSLELLKDVQCIKVHAQHEGTDKAFSTTDRGRVFSDLPFDPRLSAFVIACFTEFDKLNLASVVASILSAPGNIYFMGGASKEAKDSARRKVATRASRFDSDLLCMASVFQDWYQAGSAVDGKCLACKRKCPRHKGCRPCRVKHSMEEGLNNKVLDFVMSTSRSVEDTVKKSRIKKAQVIEDRDDLEVLSICLSRYFSEQLGDVLVPEHPPDGVRLANVGVRARITISSSFLQKLRPDPFRSFVALSVTQMPNGEYFIDRLHPVVTETKVVDQPAVVKVYQRSGVGNWIFRSFRTWCNQQMSRPEWYWSVCVFDNAKAQLEVFNLDEYADVCRSEIDDKLDRLIDDQVKQSSTQIVAGGIIEAELIAGLKVVSIQPVKNTWRIRLQDVPIQAASEFKPWAFKFFGDQLPKTSVKWIGGFAPRVDTGDGSGYSGVIIVKSEEAANHIRVKGDKYIHTAGSDSTNDPSSGGQSTDLGDFLHQEQMLGTRLILNAKCPIDATTIKRQFERYGLSKVEVIHTTKAKCSIYISNLPVTYTKEWLTAFVGPDFPALEINTRGPKVVGGNTYEAFLVFDDPFRRDVVAQHLNQFFSDNGVVSHVSFMNKQGKPVSKMSPPRVLADPSKDQIPGSVFTLQFSDASKTDEFYKQQNTMLQQLQVCTPLAYHAVFQLESRGEVKIKYPELFPNLQDLMSSVASTHQVFVALKGVGSRKSVGKNTTPTKIMITGGAPSAIAKAASALKSLTASILLMGSSEKQKAFYEELRRSESFKQTAISMGLRVDWEAGPRGEIFGPRTYQGALMKHVAGLYDLFDARYMSFSLIPAVNNLFANGKAGNAKFRELAAAWKGKCKLKHRLFSSDIIAHFPETSGIDDINAVRTAVEEMVQYFGGADVSAAMTCVYCVSESTSCGEFSICGHSFCHKCITSELAGEGELACPECKTPIHIKDIKSLVSADQFSNLCDGAVKNEILLHKSRYDVRPCPSSRCTAILPMAHGVQICSACSTSVCVSCDLATDLAMHEGRTCAQFQTVLESFKKIGSTWGNIIDKGNAYVSTNWTADMPSVNRIDQNPGIGWRCKAFERFCLAIEKGHSLDKGFFAWHGTGEGAIGPICDTGFDPTRRSGQVHGPGEYFGVTPNVSKGYARDTNRLILAYILDCNVISTSPGFCYVVNNPLDWVHSYCFPLLVVSYGPCNNCPTFVIRESSSVDPSVSSDDNAKVSDAMDGFSSMKISGDESTQLVSTEYFAPYRWHWSDDYGNMNPYTDEINCLLESYYDDSRYSDGSLVVTTPPIIRYLDDRPQRYEINFITNQQINASTRYIRRICRQKVDVPLCNTEGRWYVMNDSGVWGRYESLIEGKIEAAFVAYSQRDDASSKIRIQFPGRPETYEIDFMKGVQVNTVTSTSRQVKRISPSS